MRTRTPLTPRRPEALEVRRRRGGRWSWAWLAESGQQLEAHETYATAAEARDAARAAYPDLAVPPLPREHRLLRRAGHAVATVVKGAGLLAVRMLLRAKAGPAPAEGALARSERREPG